MQHAARASTVQQSKSLRLPLVSQFASKLVAMYNNDVQVWPTQAINSSSLKLHEIELGGLVSTKQLGEKSEIKQRLQTEFSVWGVSMAFDEFSVLDSVLTKSRFLECKESTRVSGKTLCHQPSPRPSNCSPCRPNLREMGASPGTSESGMGQFFDTSSIVISRALRTPKRDPSSRQIACPGLHASAKME